MKKFLKTLAVIITVLVIIFAGFFIYLTRGMDEKSQPVLQGVMAGGLADGEYEGGYEGGRWTNRVKVSVADGQITNITILQNVLFPNDESRAELFQRVMDHQTTNVDAVSGGTVTSNAYLKAIENALSAKEE